MGVQLADRTGKLFIVNSNLRLALQEGAHGAHLTSSQDLAQARLLRQSLSRDDMPFLLGKSVHGVSEAVEAESQGADYIFLGPIFDPLSKQALREPLGLASLREATQMLLTPVFALGGLDPARLPDLQKTNAIGYAGIGWAIREIKEKESGDRNQESGRRELGGE